MRDEDWKKKLTSEQYEVLRKKGTERPFTGKYLNHNKKGVYTCAGCGSELFKSEGKFELPKFDGNSGWPSFHTLAKNNAVKLEEDNSYGMRRTEIRCSKCDGHLGHLFYDGPTDTKEHYCVNSVALDFKKNN